MTNPGAPPAPDRSALRTARLIAVVAGLVGLVLAVLTPLLPVTQQQATISWPQNGTLTSIDAPLVSYEPISLDVHLPCATAATLPDGGNLLSTVPKQSADAELAGLVVKVGSEPDRTVQVILRNTQLISAPLAELGGCSAIVVHSDATHTTVTFAGLPDADADAADGATSVDLPGDLRPQMVGVFSDLQGAAPAGLAVHADIDSRFSSSPTVFKLLAMIVGVLATALALLALHRLDSVDGRRARRFLPRHWWTFTGVDALVAGVLVLWHFIGANTSDDGYLLNMARASEQAGYMANYFRWFGVPEAPFGWYYDVLTLMTKVGTASTWMRLPALIAAILCWMVVSREVIPRLGRAVRHNRIALWTAGLVFLSFWLPYNNGLRPEPIIALGALLTWCSIERAIATGRLLPAAVGVLIAAFSLAAGPTGLIAVAALIVGARPLVQIAVTRARQVGWLPLLAPIGAAGLVVLIVIFADQTLATVLESTRVRSAVGPNVQWFDEYHRYDALMNVSPDGSLARRFGVFVMILSVVVCGMMMLRRGGRIAGTAAGPSRRILGIIVGSLLLMMFTPTKWTHHFGVYAGIAGSVAALAAVAVAAATLRSRRNRTLFAAAVLFLLSMAFSGSNGWWYVSSYGVPWWDKPPSIGGNSFANGLLVLSVLALLLAGWQHLRQPYLAEERPVPTHGWRALLDSPLTLAAAFVVLFEVLSLAKGAVAQYPAYSVARSNFDTLTGDTCALADDVLIEPDANVGMLSALSGAPDPLGGEEAKGFTPNGVPVDLTADAENKGAGGANSLDSTTTTTTTGTAAGTGGGTGATGVNGSSVALPFGLDPARTPVLGSYQVGEQVPAQLISDWYGLPHSGAAGSESQRSDAAPILVVTAAGRIRSVDKDGVVTPGQDLAVEYGTRTDDGQVEVRGRVAPIDIGPSPSWRNLRVPTADIPADADAVRLVADDRDLTPKQWLAVTPPRVPQLQTLNEVVGTTAPVLLDWSVGLSFPCQRPFAHEYGVAEVPEYRILPDRVGADSTNGWQDKIGGGPLGWIDLLLTSRTMPSYLNKDWARDWGSLEKYTPLDPAAVTGQVDTEPVTRSGLWSPGPLAAR
ncbi:arabinosyltransferase C [Rhodococcus tukisamuensis]|uniref:Arabinosyltransferase C n=1 Tax=Rhodococcus tukisamuensis TaxID=168276 RepID=A0A1G6MER9_9NOCA|nr:arabinosyltransferase domain-containing protein [Rhodococcus tukisamuensis]SDC53980.1 arabinosyltransferase C [Rhodococcus tukisamuensis]